MTCSAQAGHPGLEGDPVCLVAPQRPRHRAGGPSAPSFADIAPATVPDRSR